jgi:cyclophilin family peptidyl-prolyl cis-trans isomerase/HEAT repeat protein
VQTRLRYSAAWLIVAAAACAPRPPLAEPAPADRHVRLDPSAIEAVAELLRMEDVRTFDTALVARLLGHAEAEVRGRAALAAGRVRDGAAAPLLLRALGDSDFDVRARAAFALSVLGDTAAQVVTALADAALSGVPETAAEATAALGLLGAASGRPALELLLASERTPPAVRERALLAIWRLPRVATSTAAVKAWTRHPDVETRWRAVYALARFGGVSVVEPLLGAMDDSDARVRMQALRGLRASLVDSAGLRNAVLPALLDAVADPHPHVRVGAIRLLPAYRDSQAVEAVLGRLSDPDANVAVAAAQALGEGASASALGALLDHAARAERPDAVRAAALASAVRLRPGAGVPLAERWIDSTRWLPRVYAARALAAAPWPLARPLLERLARDVNPIIAAEALAAVRTSADTLPDIRRLYLERLGAADPLVRAAALRGLHRIAGPADLDVLLHAFDRARHDTVRDAALAALDALATLAEAGVPARRAFYARFRDTPPRDPAVLRAAASRLGPPPADWAVPPDRIDARPFEFYMHAAQHLVARTLAGEPPPQVGILTAHGEIVLDLAAADAPLTVANFLALVENGYYAGTRWHRVVPNFVIQDGDPRGDGLGGPGYVIRDEINPLRYLRGTLGMALSGPDTGGSQFFITHSPQPHLDGGYTVFGSVTAGMDAVDRVLQDEPILGFRRIR